MHCVKNNFNFKLISTTYTTFFKKWFLKIKTKERTVVGLEFFAGLEIMIILFMLSFSYSFLLFSGRGKQQH